MARFIATSADACDVTAQNRGYCPKEDTDWKRGETARVLWIKGTTCGAGDHVQQYAGPSEREVAEDDRTNAHLALARHRSHRNRIFRFWSSRSLLVPLR